MVSNIEVEASRFARTVEEIEKLMRDGGQAGPGYPLAARLNSAQGRLDSLRAEEEHADVEKKEKEQKDRSAIAAMVERETKLNEEEKKKYAEFLSKDYFTRSDLGDLSRFYADGGAYDRLSNDGKAQMSDRIEEGIRRGEFSREELPSKVNEKNEEFRENSSANDRSASASKVISSGNYRSESSIPEDSLSTDKQSSNESKTDVQPSKSEMPEGLAGLAKLSPVQETDAVVVPQTERSGQGHTRGG